MSEFNDNVIFNDPQNTVIKSFKDTLTSFPSYIQEILSNSTSDTTNVKFISFDPGSELVSLGDWAFSNCNLENISLKECKKLSTLPQWCFRNCKTLISIELPENGCFTDIKQGAFTNCDSIPQIEFPSTLLRFEDCLAGAGAVFHGCKSLKTVYFKGKSQCYQLGSVMFYSCSSLECFIVPPLVKTLPDHIFQHCTSLRRIVMTSPEPIVTQTTFTLMDPSIVYVYVSTHKAKETFESAGILRNHLVILPLSTLKERLFFGRITYVLICFSTNIIL